MKVIPVAIYLWPSFTSLAESWVGPGNKRPVPLYGTASNGKLGEAWKGDVFLTVKAIV